MDLFDTYDFSHQTWREPRIDYYNGDANIVPRKPCFKYKITIEDFRNAITMWNCTDPDSISPSTVDQVEPMFLNTSTGEWQDDKDRFQSIQSIIYRCLTMAY
jgi:hypothetical protein